MFKTTKFFLFLFLFLFLALGTSLLAQHTSGSTKRPLTHADYDSWKSINNPQISVDGKWILYLETPQKGDADLVVLNPDKNIEYRHRVGYTGTGTPCF